MFKRFLWVALALGALPASASVSYFVGDPAGYGLATAGLNLTSYYNFSSDAVVANVVIDTHVTNLDFGGFISNQPGGLSIDNGNLELTTLGNATDYLRIDFPANVYAASFHLANLVGNSRVWTYGPPGGSATGSITVTNTGVFFGIVSDQPLSAISLRYSSSLTMMIQDFSVGTIAGQQGSETPEPSTMAMMGTALIALPLAVRRRRRRSLPRPAAEPSAQA